MFNDIEIEALFDLWAEALKNNRRIAANEHRNTAVKYLRSCYEEALITRETTINGVIYEGALVAHGFNAGADPEKLPQTIVTVDITFVRKERSKKEATVIDWVCSKEKDYERVRKLIRTTPDGLFASLELELPMIDILKGALKTYDFSNATISSNKDQKLIYNILRNPVEVTLSMTAEDLSELIQIIENYGTANLRAYNDRLQRIFSDSFDLTEDNEVESTD